MRRVLSTLLIAAGTLAHAQFVVIPPTGEAGRTSGTGRPPALLFNGDVFIANGWGSAEIYERRTKTFTRAGVFPVQLLDGIATLGLSDGRAVVSGGGNSNVDVRNYLLIWTPQSRSFRQLPGMISSRRRHAMLQLDSDRLLIVGGEGSPNTWEIYDLRQEKPLASGPLPLTLNTAVTMHHPSGKVVFLGGSNAVIYDRGTSSFAPGYGLPPSGGSGAAAEMLVDGRILVTGGIRAGGPSLRGIATAVIVDPLTGNQEALPPMLNARFWHAATRLPSGKVLITGGSDECSGRCRPAIAPAEIFDPSTESFSAVESMNFPRLDHLPVRLSSGDVLIIGGENGTDSVPGPELYVTEAAKPNKRRAARH